jgi:hypothetical protein
LGDKPHFHTLRPFTAARTGSSKVLGRIFRTDESSLLPLFSFIEYAEVILHVDNAHILSPYYQVRNPCFINEYIIYVSVQQITIITIEQNSCLINFQTLPTFLGLPNHMSQSSFQK